MVTKRKRRTKKGGGGRNSGERRGGKNPDLPPPTSPFFQRFSYSPFSLLPPRHGYSFPHTLFSSVPIFLLIFFFSLSISLSLFFSFVLLSLSLPRKQGKFFLSRVLIFALSGNGGGNTTSEKGVLHYATYELDWDF